MCPPLGWSDRWGQNLERRHGGAQGAPQKEVGETNMANNDGKLTVREQLRELRNKMAQLEPTAAQCNLAHLRVKGRSGIFGLRPKIPSLYALDTPAHSVVGRLWLVPIGWV